MLNLWDNPLIANNFWDFKNKKKTTQNSFPVINLRIFYIKRIPLKPNINV